MDLEFENENVTLLDAQLSPYHHCHDAVAAGRFVLIVMSSRRQAVTIPGLASP